MALANRRPNAIDIDPSIPEPIRRALTTLKEVVEVREGRRPRQDQGERFIRYNDLVDLGYLARDGARFLASISDSVAGGGSAGGGFEPDYSTPPQATGLTASGGFGNVTLQWDDPYSAYGNHGVTEVWRANVDDIGQAVLQNSPGGRVWSDVNVAEDTEYFYWIRWVSRWDVAGPFNAVAGTSATTAVDVDYVLSIIQGAVTESELYGDLNARIDLIDTPTTGLIDRMVAAEGNVATLDSEVSTLQTDLSSEVTARETLATQLRGAYTGTDITQVTTGLIYSERQARSTADSAMASDITALDTRITDAEGDIAGQATAITSLDTRVTDNEGDITAQASSITQLQTDVGDNTSTIQVQATSINGLESQFTVKIQNDVDGAGTDAVAGFGLSSGPPDETGVSSNFYVLADRFAIAHPGGSEVPFVVQGNNVYLDNLIAQRITVVDAMVDTLNANKLFAVSGTVFELLVNAATAHTIAVSNYIGSSNFVAGSAGWRIHGDGSSEFRNIIARGNIEATSLQAGTAMVGTAHIQNAAVDTLQLAGQAVTIPSSAYTAGSMGINNTWTPIQQLSYTATGASAFIHFSGVLTAATGGIVSEPLPIRVLRNGVEVYRADETVTFIVEDANEVTFTKGGGVVSLSFSDAPPAGVATYTVQTRYVGGTASAANRSLLALEIKR